ncbi:MAG: glycogen debranching protein [Verrucomicrobia bacterium]|nr:MAG: glycogen debranching protein [Verrucomicrobiota bacterium]
MNPIDPNAAGPASGGQPLQQESYAGQGQPKRTGWAAQPLDSSGCPPGAERAEWLEADGLGGFASGTVSGVRSRRYHALLLTATTPPAGRMVLVNGFDAWVETPRGTFAISSQRYVPDVIHPDGASSWRMVAGIGDLGLKLKVRPFLSGRDFHSTHHENGSFRFDGEQAGERITFRSYDGVPAIIAYSNGYYTHEPTWYRNFVYLEEQARGLDSVEDLASPGVFEFSLSQKPTVLMLAAEGHAISEIESIEARYAQVRTIEQRRREYFSSPLERAADAYLVKRGKGKTLIAGYPWFGDWGRDTFIALRGLCVATGRLEDARDILVEWAGTVSQGMLPNRFPDQGAQLEFNSVDASLWYVIAVNDYLLAAENQPLVTDDCHTKKLRAAIEAILAGYNEGTRFGIRADRDGLLSAGEPGQQLTWMDARVEGREITPRIGKPVEIQALWLNALAIAAKFSARWQPLFEKGRAAFESKFWSEHAGYLADVIDCDHQPGVVDLTFRPNQIFAIGGLPLTLLSKEKARHVVDSVEKLLLTPVGLRSLAPGEPGYAAHYGGSVAERDGSYHQGTVWPWLIGPFVEAWVRVHGSNAGAKKKARTQFLPPLYEHLNHAGLGHVSEICDAEPPHTPRGCPFQAWSLGELLRLERSVL